MIFKIIFYGQMLDIKADFLSVDYHRNRLYLKISAKNTIEKKDILVASFPLDKTAFIEKYDN